MENVKKLILCVLMLSLVSTDAVADIHYVFPGDSIRAAINAADPGDEIAVMPGYYSETLAIDFGNSLKLYSLGGPEMTIIDGTAPYHVIQCVSGAGPDTILEGFTIIGGGGFTSHGSGMYNDGSSPTVTNCIFRGNKAIEGGGMYNFESSPTVTNCTFTGNTANHFGGGMYNVDSSPTVTNCIFRGNITDLGGGMYNENSNPTVTNCTFTGNTANHSGGGMYNDHSSPTVTNCTFTDNTAINDGGGMLNTSLSEPTMTNCTFTENTASGGGGMSSRSTSSPTVTNCTFSGNTADFGGGMHNYGISSPMVTNCILWDDSPDEIFDDGTGSLTVTYSDVQGGWPGTGNIDTDPLFADADLRLSDTSPCINAGSNAALPPDTADLDGDGDTTEPIPLDMDGNARILNGVVDMGAFETYIIIDFSGWVWMVSDINFGYSLNEDDLLYFLSFGPVWYYNITTSQWSEEGPVGWTYVNWPFLYESATSTTMFALPPASGLSVYHFRTGQWTISPRIIP